MRVSLSYFLFSSRLFSSLLLSTRCWLLFTLWGRQVGRQVVVCGLLPTYLLATYYLLGRQILGQARNWVVGSRQGSRQQQDQQRRNPKNKQNTSLRLASQLSVAGSIGKWMDKREKDVMVECDCNRHAGWAPMGVGLRSVQTSFITLASGWYKI